MWTFICSDIFNFNMSEHNHNSVLTLSLRITPTMNKPRFSDIARHLKEGITSGHYPVGTLLPTELELRDHYKTSRHTVRAALQELQQLGLVSRRKNVGTRVESATPQVGFQQSLASVEDVVQFGATHVRVVREVETVEAKGALARLLGCAEGTAWLRISSLRMDEEQPELPICWTDLYMDPAYTDLVERVRDSPETLVSTLIEQQYGRRVVEIVQQLQALEVPAAMARQLGVETGSAALQIVRRYLDAGGETIDVTVTVHPADRFSLTMRLQRSAG
ncbi:DNA-binding transcriptional regulator, GntR family [Variovorax sp. CF079]|nr:DNA-binding transcriptional regulator, GntR family [Variovorax sp. CF079]